MIKSIFLSLALLLAPALALATPPTSSVSPSNCVTNGINTVCNPLIGNVQAADQNLNIDQRPPAQTDDSAHDYANPYSFWALHTPTGTRVFQQLLNNAGFPQWQDMTLGNGLNLVGGTSLPANVASVSPAACWWTKQVNSNYTGPILRAQFADAATLDVQQISGGVPDQATLWATAALHGFPARVTTWYDQCNVGGTQANAAQATAANQPLLIKDRDGDLAVVYDQYVNSTTRQTRILNISTNLAVTQDAASIFSVSSVDSINQAAPSNVAANIAQIGNSGGSHALQLIEFYNTGVTLFGDGTGPTVSAGWLSMLPSMSYLVTSPSGRTYAVDGYPSLTKGGDLGANALTGGVLGMAPGGPTGGTVTQEVTTDYGHIVFASTLSAPDILSEEVAIHSMGKTTPQARCNVVLIGESITQGFLAAGAQSWAHQLQEMLPKSVRVVNFGWSSQGIGNTSPSNISLYPTTAAYPFNAADRCNIAIIYGGNTNDYFNGSGTPLITAAQEQTYINTLAGLAVATGYRTFVTTAIDRGGGGSVNPAFYTQLAAITASIVSNAGANNYTPIRVDLDPELGTYASSSANTACFPDTTHLSAVCAANFATEVKNAIAPFIRPGG